ncbi:bifunctional non-homologous end joining protein LigD [Streptomyces sp. Amel2xB2]|uniref:non-homologous end-joining DNA ligase n=1 Tax=Streptomyces sp. Amel2xB2 TaxID=1305829 RepID=UPI000DBA539C|nr:non-homologous end-joining DNA ligase [Streptomyces sp. Amel2xB2]RAJ70147.1 bifunctional non-homologous end joining protein LigD [Streptomyces sp. Amel2xB2]
MPYTEVEGRRLALSNLDKVLYPATGFTKGEALHYYVTVAGALLPHLRGRPVSFLRYPDGVDATAFFAKNVPPGAPGWVTVREITQVSSEPLRQVLVEDLPTLVWAANLAGLELHTPQWCVEHEAQADRLVFDLDPGPGAGVLECRTVALWLRERLAADGLTVLPKTSGGKGLHLLAPIEVTPSSAVSAYAKRAAVEAEAALPGLALSKMARALRPGKVFVDHSQNAAAKTTAAPYTLRAKQRPSVSTPLSWEELEAARSADELVFLADQVPLRLENEGDLMAPLLDPGLVRPLPGT